MLRIAGQTAKPIGLVFFVGIHAFMGSLGCFRLKKSNDRERFPEWNPQTAVHRKCSTRDEILKA